MRFKNVANAKMFLCACLLSFGLQMHVGAEEVVSPSFASSVSIEQGADLSVLNNSILRIFKNNLLVASYPTYGYILNAAWNSNENYIAVNNRRANSGDYAWVFRMSDGYVLRKPVDACSKNPENAYLRQCNDLLKRMKMKHPDLAAKGIDRTCTVVKGWDGQNVVRVVTEITFSHVSDQMVIIEDKLRIKDNSLVSASTHMRLAPIVHQNE